MTSMLNTDLPNPFSIGLAPLDKDQFIQIDNDFLPYRKEKQALYQSSFPQIFMAEPETQNAQREVCDLILSNLKKHHSDLYEFTDDSATCTKTGEQFELGTDAPIADIALLIPEDLILMRRDERGWRLVAASLCFPSSWNLQQKFSKPMEAIHGPVPIPEKMSQRINRIFDGLRPEIPTWRTNWALVDDGDLRHDRTEEHHHGTVRLEKSAQSTFLRTEFQTLHKLPQSNDILFTVRIKTHPISHVGNDETGRAKLTALHDQYLEMTDAERAYKGMDHHADSLIKWLANHSPAS